jgi:hypothetical protein
MYAKGWGVSENGVVAYALYNLSAAGDPSESNGASGNRSAIMESMTNREIEMAQQLTREMAKPGNLLKALDNYMTRPIAKGKSSPAASQRSIPPRSDSAGSGNGFPERPPKRAGVVSCNTQCINADCRRTYDDGRHVRFQAKRVYDALSGDWKWDSGSC